ncbi:MAG: RluA family pseudouridine synthase [Candidatus Berkelbacteria bacterium]|nr:RluA family pseudouridine synthase [Candidatus Berkelbacteria bacterium]
MAIKVLLESKEYLVISKLIGISVHSGAGKEKHTVRDWFWKKYPEIQNLAWKTKTREGIIHRLDKDTSGLLILAKTPKALEYFQSQFKNRKIEKHYIALVFGKPPFEEGEINALVYRDPKDREKQKVSLIDFALDEQEKKFSATKYKVLRYYTYKNQVLTLLDVKILTGRKHQIRIHMKHEGCPVIGDNKYFTKPSRRISAELGLKRQFLHASRLRFRNYPRREIIEIEDTLPRELRRILKKLKSIES